MIPDLTYSEAKRKAAALKECGVTEIYLYQISDAPWGKVDKVSAGGSHRLDIATSAAFSAHDEESGLDFRWVFDIEPSRANGSGRYQIDVAGCQMVMSRLPLPAQKEFADYLANCADKIEHHAKEMMGYVVSEFGAAEALRRALPTEVK